MEEVAECCRERKNAVDPVVWWNFYAAKGWMIGKTKMVDWKRAVISWERNRSGNGCDVAPSVRLNPKAAAFERQRAEAEERRRHAEAVAASLMERHRAESTETVGRRDPRLRNRDTTETALSGDCGGQGAARPTNTEVAS